MINVGDRLLFSGGGKETACRVDTITEDLSVLTIIDSPNTLSTNVPYHVSIMNETGSIEGGCKVQKVAQAFDSKNQPINGVLTYTVKMTKPFERVQKRQFFRHGCSLNVSLSEVGSEKKEYGLITNISAGGARIATNAYFAYDGTIMIEVNLNGKNLTLFGMVLDCKKQSNINVTFNFVMRVQFIDKTKEDEDAIVKYIFNEFRKMRAKEKT